MADWTFWWDLESGHNGNERENIRWFHPGIHSKMRPRQNSYLEINCNWVKNKQRAIWCSIIMFLTEDTTFPLWRLRRVKKTPCVFSCIFIKNWALSVTPAPFSKDWPKMVTESSGFDKYTRKSTSGVFYSPQYCFLLLLGLGHSHWCGSYRCLSPIYWTASYTQLMKQTSNISQHNSKLTASPEACLINKNMTLQAFITQEIPKPVSSPKYPPGQASIPHDFVWQPATH